MSTVLLSETSGFNLSCKFAPTVLKTLDAFAKFFFSVLNKHSSHTIMIKPSSWKEN